MREARKPGKLVLLAFGTFLVGGGLVLVEGMSSWLVVAGEMLAGPADEKPHNRYDAELGWVHRPGLRIPDAYGTATPFTTNARGFRAVREVAPSAAPGTARVVCLGDSFTMGYGVGDADTWPARLERLDRRLEVVNMGQGGYGADQAYLWHRRDARDVEHHALVFTLITIDFDRLKSSTFLGHGKPYLELANGSLVTRNTPVPGMSLRRRFLRGRDAALRELRTAQLLGGLGSGGSRRPSPDRDQAVPDREVPKIWAAILASLRDSSRSAGRELLIVFLPTYFECRAGRAGPWYAMALAEARAAGVRVVDLVPGLLALPFGSLHPLYLEEPFHHLSPKGNEVVARHVWEALRSSPPVLDRLGP